jgi:hypothetical protein
LGKNNAKALTGRVSVWVVASPDITPGCGLTSGLAVNRSEQVKE